MKLVNGVGINDADYVVTPMVNGVQVWCPYYRVWKGMMDRAYLPSKNRSSYKDVTVCGEWHRFMRFREWMNTRSWEGLELDKDLLFDGNTVYSPERCLFVTTDVNLFMTDCRKARGSLPIGVSFYKKTGRFQAGVSQLNGRRKHLGYYDTPNEAHAVYKKAKFELAKILSERQENKIVANALISRYAL